MANPVAREYFRRAEQALDTPVSHRGRAEVYAIVQAFATMAIAAAAIDVDPADSIIMQNRKD